MDLLRSCASRDASTSVSVVALIVAFRSRCASSEVLIRLPLWASARPPPSVELRVGWAFSHTLEPVVE